MTSSHDPSHQYIIGCGSNLGDRLALLTKAAELVAAHGSVLARAPLYETMPIGAADGRFLNSALLVATSLEPRPLLSCLLAIEAELGRVRTVRWGNRTVDLDILLWRQVAGGTWREQACADVDLTIPHRALLERDFALVPAANLAPLWIHPETGQSLACEVRRRGYALTPSPAKGWN